ncbi:MAG: tryptophanase [Gammaproteobacteria bacterium]|jgi:tryptophanase
MQLPKAKTIIEPFRIKTVEPIPFAEPEARIRLIREKGFNLFKLPADAVTFDLLTDSGTSAMSARQWAAMMVGDESYAGSSSFYHFESVVRELTGMRYIIPTHQGRSAEALLMRAMIRPGQTVVGNTHFDTTRANIEAQQATALDLPHLDDAFKGNINLTALKQTLDEQAGNVPLVIMTVTNNAVGGQPVSMHNLQRVKALLKEKNIPLFIDAARFAENAYLIKRHEAGYEKSSVKEIAQAMFALADGVLMSAKKDAFGNIGGFLAVQDEGLAEEVRSLMVITEGFPTYGGLAGRDLEALAVGLQEILSEEYLSYRIRSVAYFGEGIENAGYHVIKPFGGHAVYIDAGKSLPHLSPLTFPGQSLSVALFEAIGIRGVEVGSVMLGKHNPDTNEEEPAPFELVRLAMPRRVYTQSHVDFMIEMLGYLQAYIAELPGYAFDYQPKVLRHFNATFKRLSG